MPIDIGNVTIRSRLKILVAQKEIQERRKIRQNKIAEETGLNPNTISRWMSPMPFDRFEVEPTVKLCLWLGCELGDLLYIDRG
jgi:putative transcriptional regulator